MNFKHKILALSYPAIKTYSSTKRYFDKKISGSLRVLVYHDIAPSEIKKFRAQISWMKKNWTFINPEEFDLMMTGQIPINGDNLLLTFDDGFISNRIVAEKVLKPMGIHAIFFIVSGFVDQTNVQDCHSFISKGIRSDLKVSEMSKHWKNMDWDDLEFLLDQKHTIGSHTATHAKLSSIFETKALEHEIIDSANLIEDKLGTKIDHFAFTFGNNESISHEAIDVARKKFKFIHTSIRGVNKKGISPFLIFRDTITPNDYNHLLGSFLLGGADSIYKKDRQGLRDFYD
jgi:peptidoglycan/xylan/chitin deacetylase (PgdA/CDA1 family)